MFDVFHSTGSESFTWAGPPQSVPPQYVLQTSRAYISLAKNLFKLSAGNPVNKTHDCKSTVQKQKTNDCHCNYSNPIATGHGYQ